MIYQKYREKLGLYVLISQLKSRKSKDPSSLQKTRKNYKHLLMIGGVV